MKILLAKLRGARRSLTVWFNGGMLTLVSLLPSLAEALPLLKDYLPADFYQLAFTVVAVGNILIRGKTNKSLEDR